MIDEIVIYPHKKESLSLDTKWKITIVRQIMRGKSTVKC